MVLVLAVVLFFLGKRIVLLMESLGGQLVLLAVCFVFSVPVILFSVYYFHWFDEFLLFYQYRSLPYTEFSVVFLAFFTGGIAGCVKRYVHYDISIIILTCLLAFLFVPYAKRVIHPLDKSFLKDRWKDDVCLQSSGTTCGAASAATILKHLGYEMSELQVAEEAFTTNSGTENWYLARVFRRRGFRVNYRVEKGFPNDLALPAIAGVRFGAAGHFITVLEKKDGQYVFGDPLQGQVEAGHPEDAFDFTGFFMEIRP